MNLFFTLKNRIHELFERKKAIIILILLFLSSIVCGIVFIKNGEFYQICMRNCSRFVDYVCFSQVSVFKIFLERFLAHLLILSVVLLTGITKITSYLSPVILVYRGFFLGGNCFLLIAVYHFSGILILLLLYLPIHLAVDFLLTVACIHAFDRSKSFYFCKDGLLGLASDLALYAISLLAIHAVETLILFAIFHPLGAAV